MTVYRLRAGLVFDEYSETYKRADWTEPEELALPGAFIDRSSTAMVVTANRTQALESLSLFCAADVEIELTDRIRDGESGGRVYSIDGVPAAPTNPFTGWQPVREVPLGLALG